MSKFVEHPQLVVLKATSCVRIHVRSDDERVAGDANSRVHRKVVRRGLAVELGVEPEIAP